MSKSNALESDLLAYVFTGTAFPWAAATNLVLRLHTANPGEGGLATDSEATYTGYAALNIARNGTNWTVTGNQVSNDNIISFGANTGSLQTITHVTISAQGSTSILYIGTLGTPLAVATGIQPQILAGALTISEE
jgi:hypothetical protein